MSELDLWASIFAREDFKSLLPQDRLVLLEIAAWTAQAENTQMLDGWFPESLLNSCTWDSVAVQESIQRLEGHWLTRHPENGCWEIVGFTTPIGPPRPGNPEWERPAWGQQSLEKRLMSRAANAKRQAEWRERARALAAEHAEFKKRWVDPETGEILAPDKFVQSQAGDASTKSAATQQPIEGGTPPIGDGLSKGHKPKARSYSPADLFDEFFDSDD